MNNKGNLFGPGILACGDIVASHSCAVSLLIGHCTLKAIQLMPGFHGGYLYVRLMKTYHLPVVVETDEDGIFIVSCPIFKGCHTYGKTIDEAMSNLKEVVEICVSEQPMSEENKFIGVREIEFKIPATA